MWNFVKRPDNCWSISSVFWIVAGAAVPSLRLAASILLAFHLAVLIAGIVNLRTGFFCKARCSLPKEKKRFALTFDDGPDPELTPAILGLLDEYGITATFFCIARRVEKYPDITRDTVGRGHTIGCHDLEHRPTANFRRHRRMVAEISEACSIIASVTGKSPRLYRPPVGLSNPHLRTALEELDMECIGWNRRLGDGGNRFAKRLNRMPELARPGSVIMLHDCLPDARNREIFLKNLRALCERMKAGGLAGVGVGELFGIKPYQEACHSA